MAFPGTVSHVVPVQRKIVLASLTTQAAPWGSTAMRTAPPGILSHAVPFQRWMVRPPGTGSVPIAHSTPLAPRPTSVALPSIAARLGGTWARSAVGNVARSARTQTIHRFMRTPLLDRDVSADAGTFLERSDPVHAVSI